VEEIAISAIAAVTGRTVEDRSILNIHRQGRKKNVIYVEFMYSQVMSQILHPKHIKNAHLKGIFLNIFQPAHDRHLGRMARRMKKAELIHDTYSNLSRLTIVLTKGKKEKVEIRSREDLETFAEAKGRRLSEFDDDDVKIVDHVELMEMS